MTDLKLDTSGIVDLPRYYMGHQFDTSWIDLTPFEQGYIEGMLDGLRKSVGRYRSDDTYCAFSDLAGETLQRIKEDCAEFVTYAKDVCKVDCNNRSDGEWWWQARQRGEWASPSFPPLTVYLDDDGKVRFQD